MQTEEPPEVEPQRQYVIFRLDSTEFAVPIEEVTRILRLTKCTRIPRAPAFLEGVINLHGDIVPVVDLRKRFQLAGTPSDDEARIVVVEMDDQRVGLIVDAVTEILRLPPAAIDPPPAMVADINGVYLAGVATQDDRLFIILDLSRVLTTEEITELEEMEREA